MHPSEQPTPPQKKGPTGNGQDTLYDSLAKYIHELGHYSFNEKPNDYIRINKLIEDLMEILLNSHSIEMNGGLIIDADELTKDAYKKGIKLYNKKKAELHRRWTLTLITIATLTTILYSILS